MSESTTIRVAQTLTAAQVAAEVQPEADAIADAPSFAVPSGEFVFFAAFDGTDNGANPATDGSNDPQTTAVRQLYEQVVNQSPNVQANYFPGPGTPGTLPGSDGSVSLEAGNVLGQAIIAAQNAYTVFAQEATTWLVSNPGGSLTSMIVSFSRGGASAAIFAQMLYENGLVNAQGVTLIPAGQIGAVSAALIIDPVLTEDTNINPLSSTVTNNMDFPNTVENLTIVSADDETRQFFDRADYNDPNAHIYQVRGNHGDAGDFYDDGLGGIYLQAYTSFLKKAGLTINAVPTSRQYVQGTSAAIHTEVGNPPVYDNPPFVNAPGPRVTKPAGTPVTTVANSTIFTAYNGDFVIGGNGYNISAGDASTTTWVLLPGSSAIVTNSTSRTEIIILSQYDTLYLSSNLNLDTVTFDFPSSNTIDISGIPVADGIFNSTDVLTVSGGGGAEVDLQLDPTLNYSTASFLLMPDGTGGTNIISEDDRQTFTFAGTQETLLLVDPIEFIGTILNFQRSDTIDFRGVAKVTGATVSTGGMLTLTEMGGGASAAINLDPTKSYSGDSFLIAPDGAGGTDITAEADAQSIAFTGSDEDLPVSNPGSLVGTISAFLSGDTIDLANVGTVVGATLSARSVLALQESGGGSDTLNLDPTQNYSGYSFLIAPDGAAGTDITAEADAQPIAFTGSAEDLLVINQGSLTGTITPFAGDTIDLTGVTGVVGAGLGSNNVLAIQESGGGTVDLGLNLTTNDDYGDLLLESDGSGGTNIVLPGGTGSNYFQPGDVLDLAGEGSPSPFVTEDYVSNQYVDFYLSSGQSGIEADPTKIANESFLIAPDGAYGTDVTGYEDNQSIAFTGSDEILMIADAANFTGTITNVQIGDVIYLGGFYSVFPTLKAGNVLSLEGPYSIKLDPAQNLSGDAFLFSPAQSSGAVIQVAPAAVDTGPQTFTVNAGTPEQTSVNISATSVQFSPARDIFYAPEDWPLAQWISLTATYAGGPGMELAVPVNGGIEHIPIGPQTPTGTIVIPDYYISSSFDGSQFSIPIAGIGNINVTVPVYSVAQAAFSINGSVISSYDFGIIHVGQTASVEIGISNTATGALVDTLSSSTGNIGEFSTENAISDIASGNAGTVTVGFTAEAAGTATVGAELFNLTSHDDVLPDVPAETAALQVSAEVYEYAQPTLIETQNGFESAGAPLTQTGVYTWSLDFGTIVASGNPNFTNIGIDVSNAVPVGVLSDTLGGSFSSSGSGFIESGGTQVPYLGNFTPELTNFGTHTVTVVYSPTSIDSAGTTALQDITLTVTDNIALPQLQGATIVGQGNVVTASIDAGQDVLLDSLFETGVTIGTLIIQGPGTAEIDTFDSVPTLEIASTGLLFLNGGYLYTDPVTIDANGNLFGNGVIAGNELANGTITASGGTLDITGNVTGIGTLTFAAGGALQLEGTVAATESLIFNAPNETLILEDTADLMVPISGFGTGDQIILNTTAAATFNLNGSVVSVIENGTTVDTLTFATSQMAQGAIAGTSGTLMDNVLCFLPGTFIMTPSGQREVERLAAGDTVLTASGQVRPIVWIGTGRVLATRGRRNAATPVIVCKGALGPNVPHQDLRVTKGHSLYIDDVLIPVEYLVNHRSILWDDWAQEVTVYHLELDTHDVLLANGAPAESYRDDGNRWLFQNANSGWHLPPKPPCAPVLTGGPIVDAVWRRLLDRAGPRPSVPLTADPDLHLLVDGTRLDGGMQSGDFHIFSLPRAPGEVRLISRAAAPQELGLSRDPRCLGVAVRRIVVRQRTRFQKFDAKDKRLVEGFHAFEADENLRWTDGDALLPPEMFAGLTGPIEVVLHIALTAQYAEGVAVARAA